MKKVGNLNEKIIRILSLDTSIDSSVYIGPANETHIKKKHYDNYCNYFADLEDIIKSPDYIGLNPSNKSVELVKEYYINNEYVKVAIRLSGGQKYFVRSMYVLNNRRVCNFINKGTLQN